MGLSAELLLDEAALEDTIVNRSGGGPDRRERVMDTVDWTERADIEEEAGHKA